MTPAGIISLLTDFGNQDAYVGTMKGVMLSIHPTAQFVDLSHHVPQGDIDAGAFLLEQAWPYFPAGTVHLVVVDPGVGSQRRAIAVQAKGQLFVAPDNGVLEPVFAESESFLAVELDNPDYQLSSISRTFHGRDIFAPAAAHLAAGVKLDEFKHIAVVVRRPRPKPTREGMRIMGEVVYIDHFGNCITNIPADWVRGDCEIHVNRHRLGGVQTSYAGVNPGEPLAILASHGNLEIAARNEKASRRLDIHRRDKVTVQLEK